jgi:type VI secretion system protein ImpA
VSPDPSTIADGEIETLLRPIFEASPCGPAMRHDPAFTAIRLEREEDDPDLPMRHWERPLKRADFALIEAQCRSLLATRTKDLQIAAWLLEAWLRQEALAGLARGLALLAELGERYWDEVHPVIDDGDADARLAPFEWINEAIPRTILRHVALMALADRRPSAVTLADWDRLTASELSAAPSADASADAAVESALTRDRLIAHARGEGRTGVLRLAAETDRAIEALERLDRMLRERMGDGQAPSLGRLEQLLHHLRRVVAQLAGPMSVAAPTGPTPSAGDAMDDELRNAPGGEAAAAATALRLADWRNREEAYRTLEAIADYLGELEPHSPTPYLIRRAVQWGRLPLPELMAEILREEGDLGRFMSLLGMQSS